MESRFPVSNEDRQYLSKIDSVAVSPVFVMGFHRSGTTFIYDSVAKCFPFANLDLYHIFFYERLLKNYLSNNESNDRRWFSGYIKSQGIHDRGLDKFEVKDDMVEEYCWVLSKSNHFFPAARTTERSRHRLKEVCQKVLYTQPNAGSILLKNPFDFANGELLLRAFPTAKFIFVRRTPAEILNSNFNSYIRMSRPHPFFDLMQMTQPPLSRGVAKCLAFVMNKLSDEQILKLVAFNVKNLLKKKLISAKASMQRLPRDSYVIADYDEFKRDPVSSLQQVRDLLKVEFSSPPELIEAKPRKTELLDVTRKYADEINRYSL